MPVPIGGAGGGSPVDSTRPAPGSATAATRGMPSNASATCTAQSVRRSPHSARAVEWVDDPHPLARQPGGRVLRLLGEHRVVGPSVGEPGQDQLVAEPVALVLRRVTLLEFEQELARFARDVGGKLVVVHAARQLVAGSSSSGAFGGRVGEEGRGRAPEDPGIDRLHEGEVDIGPARDEHVVAAVEEQQDARPRQPATRLLEPEVDGDGDASHVADLEVEHDQVGVDAGKRVAYVLAARDLDDFLAGPDERGTNLVAHPLRIGGHEDRAHRCGI